MEAQRSPVFRPLRLGELLDQAIRLYRRNFITFIGIIAVVYVPLMILQAASTALYTSSAADLAFSTPEALFSNAGYWIGFLSTLLIAFLQFILVQGVATGALARAVSDDYLGKKPTIVDAYRGIGKSWLSLIGALLFIIVVLVGISLWWLVPCIGWFTGLGMLAFLMSAVFPLVPPIIVVEGQGAIDSIQRAWNLSRRRFWAVLGTVFILALFSLLVVNGPVAIVNVVLLQFMPSLDDPGLQLVLMTTVQTLTALIFTLIYYPLQMTAFTLIYFDLRVRTEGLDLAYQTANVADEAALTQVLSAPVAQPGERFMTGTDMGNFAILTLVAAGIFIFFYTFLFGFIFFLFSQGGGF